MNGRVRIPRRALLALLLSLASTALLAVGLTRVVDEPIAVVALATAGAFPLAYLVQRTVVGPVRALLVAIGDGLLSLGEKDYGLRITPVRDPDLGELVARFNRLAEALRAEQNDRYQKEILLETVLEYAPSAVLLTTEVGRVIYANGHARDLLGAETPLEGRELGALLEHQPPELASALRAENAVFSIEREGATETYSAARRYFEISTVEHVLYVVKSVTREVAHKEAEAWKKAIRVIGHELNNSLAPISSLAHSSRLILRSPEHAHRLERVFDTIEERALHLKNFLDGYARLAKLPPPTPRPVAWAEFISGLAKLYRFRLAAPLPDEPAWFDDAQLGQAVINLLKNAIESGSDPDAIELEVAMVDGGVELCVLDRGKGMSDDTLAKATLPFYSTKKTGSGLGLALCREIVDAHGGRLRMAGRPGGGVAVVIWLPGRGTTDRQSVEAAGW